MTQLALATESLVLFRNSQGAEARGTLMRLARNSVVFEVYNPYSIVQLSEVLQDFHIRRGERTIYTGRAVVSNLVSTGLLLIVSVTLLDPWSDLIDLEPGQQLRDEVQLFIEDWHRGYHRLRPSYELKVSKIRNFLQELSRWLEHGETVAGLREPACPPGLVQGFLADVDQQIAPQLDDLFKEFEAEAYQVAPEELVSHKAFARRELHPMILCTPFVHRVYTKPLGYAGDYKMVNMILHSPWQGASTYAKLVNAAFLRNDTAQAHRNRIDRLTQLLECEAHRVTREGRVFRVLNIGCGPAQEVQRFISSTRLPIRSEIKLLDFNQETLKHTQSQIERHTATIPRETRNTRVEFVHRSIHDLLKDAVSRRPDPQVTYDMVYCAGLFDYLSDRICGKLLRLFYDWTLPGGSVIATNVHTRNPIRGMMEHLAEWYLVLRDQRDMLGLTPRTGHQRVFMEQTGTNVFLEIRKPEATPQGL